VNCQHYNIDSTQGWKKRTKDAERHSHLLQTFPQQRKPPIGILPANSMSVLNAVCLHFKLRYHAAKVEIQIGSIIQSHPDSLNFT